jgi:hypothetical protein
MKGLLGNWSRNVVVLLVQTHVYPQVSKFTVSRVCALSFEALVCAADKAGHSGGVKDLHRAAVGR